MYVCMYVCMYRLRKYLAGRGVVGRRYHRRVHFFRHDTSGPREDEAHDSGARGI